MRPCFSSVSFGIKDGGWAKACSLLFLRDGLEHSLVEVEGLGWGELDLGKAWMGWVQQDVPFAFDGNRGNFKSDGGLSGYPVCSDGLEDGVVGGAPIGRKVSQIESRQRLFVEGKRGSGGDEVVGRYAGVEMNEELDGCQGQRWGCVNHADARGIPASGIEPGPFAGECRGCKTGFADSPEVHQL